VDSEGTSSSSSSSEEEEVVISDEEEGEEEEELAEEEEEDQAPTDDEIRELFALSDEGEPSSSSSSSSSSSEEEEEESEEECEMENGIVEASREDREANEWMENILARLDNVDIPFGVVWYDPSAIQHHRSVWGALRDGVGVLNGRIRHVDPRFVWQLFEFTYQTIMGHLAELLPAPLGATDEYEHTPLLTMYRACMVFLEYLYRVGEMGRVRFFDRGTTCPEDSSYIRKYYVNVASGPISQYSMKKLVSATMQLETRWSELPLHDDLEEYLQALELAVARMVVWTYGKDKHNVREYRTPACSDPSVEEYYITPECLFRFALRFAALHEQLDSALIFRNRFLVSPPYPLLADRTQIDKVRVCLTKEAFETHDDNYQDSVRPAYQNLKMRPSECYLFHKLNKTAKRVEPMKLIEMFGEPHQWRKIVDASNVDAHEMLSRCEDTVAVRMAMVYLMDNICKQTLGGSLDWYNFYWPSNSFHHPTEVFIESRVHETRELPRYCHLMNDACVFYDGQLVSFGASPASHLQALWYWISIFQHKLMGRVNETVRTHDLYETLVGEQSRSDAFYSEGLLLQFPGEWFLRSIEGETYTKNGDLVLWDAQVRYDRDRDQPGKGKRGRKRARSSQGDWGGIIPNG